MISIRQVELNDAATLRDVRLRALADTPLAFGSTYDREIRLTDADWNLRAARWNGDRATGFIAWDNQTPCGIAGGHLDEHRANTAHLISMWVAPTHRRAGVGRLLVQSVISWARSRNAAEVHLMVTSMNDRAIRFYERLGFKTTGRVEPYPNDPALVEFEMSLPIG